MRVLFTGQTGIDKQSHLEALKDFCGQKGKPIDAVFSIGDIMYEESRKAGTPLRPGKILDLPLAQLASLRRLAFTRLTYESAGMQNVFVNSHAVFRWNNQLFRAFEFSELAGFNPDMIVTLIDDVEAIKLRLDELKRSSSLPEDTHYSLKDLIVWREEEILASQILASVLKVPQYALGVSLDPLVSSNPLEVVFSLMFEAWKKRAYISYPISDAQGKQEVWAKVLRFRKLARSYLAAFDPLMISERRLHNLMLQKRQAQPGAKDLSCDVRGRKVTLNIQEIEAIDSDIDGQIVARDYQLIDQAEMIVAYFPLDSDGGPLIAGGVQSEIEHAAALTKEVVLLWESPRDATPFIGQKIDKRFNNLDELETYLKEISQRPGQQEMSFESR